VGAALLGAIEERSGKTLDAATGAAWGRAFAWLTATMTAMPVH
jgi:hemoglobin-like flavoprotein